MKKNRILHLLLALVMLVGIMAGCGGNSNQGSQNQQSQQNSQGASASTSAPEQQPQTDAPENALKIGIIQIVEHPALDAAYKGFVDALADNGYVDGDNIVLDWQNAQNDQSNMSTISDRFVSQNVDLVLAIATPAAQAIAGKTSTIPILGTAITSYTGAGLVDSDENPGGNVSGTSDMNPVAAQIDLVKELVPGVQTIGLIYNSSEDNSVLQINIAKAAIEELGLKWTEVTVTNSGDVLQAAQSIVTKCEAIYIPTDNTIASSIATLHSVTMESKTPTICGEESMVMGGGLATMGIGYYDLGYKTGLMALEVIDGKNPADMPIQYADKSDEVTINGLVAEEIGFTVPDKYADSVLWPEE